MQEPPSIRKETPADASGIRAVLRAAFGRPAEVTLVDSLRQAQALTLSVVAIRGGRVVGHVAFSPVVIDPAAQTDRILALAPMAVLPAYQRHGIGSAMIQWALRECLNAGYDSVLVLGEPCFYQRFVFQPASQFGLQCPFAAPHEAFMALELRLGSLAGRGGMVKYRPEFDSL